MCVAPSLSLCYKQVDRIDYAVTVACLLTRRSKSQTDEGGFSSSAPLGIVLATMPAAWRPNIYRVAIMPAEHLHDDPQRAFTGFFNNTKAAEFYEYEKAVDKTWFFSQGAAKAEVCERTEARLQNLKGVK